MAEQSDLPGDVGEALAGIDAATRRKEHHRSRRVQALSLRLAGFTIDQIAERLSITSQGASDLVKRTLEQAESRSVEQMRAEENARLDRAQAAIWNKVLEGDLKSVDTFLRISKQRSTINGMNAPTKIDLSVGIRQEMETALAGLENLVLQGEIVEPAEPKDTMPEIEQRPPMAEGYEADPASQVIDYDNEQEQG